jgi:hypothetical protein
MNRNKTMTIAAAALSGLLAGSAARAAAISTTGGANQLVSNAGQRAIALDAPTPHTCKGKNACKGQGGCTSGDNGCKGKNSCKGNGGCNTTPPTTKPGI